MRRRGFLWPIVAAIAVGLVTGGLVYRNSNREVDRTEFLLDTIVSIKAGGPHAEETVDAALAEMARVERELSNYTSGSEIARVNASAGRSPVVVSREAFSLIDRMLAFSRLTGGAFDPTVGPLVDLWGFTGANPKVPGGREIAGLLPLVNAEQVVLNEAAHSVFLPNRGMKLDLGGALKGYAVDRAAAVLRARKVKYAVIDAGESSIRVVGRRPGGRPWLIGVADPRKPRAIIGVIRLNDGEALGTSADNNRFFLDRGVRYSHLLDPRTGWPARHNRLTTVKAQSAFEADMLSKLFVLPAPRALAIMDRLEVGGAIQEASGRVATRGVDLNQADSESRR